LLIVVVRPDQALTRLVWPPWLIENCQNTHRRAERKQSQHRKHYQLCHLLLPLFDAEHVVERCCFSRSFSDRLRLLFVVDRAALHLLLFLEAEAGGHPQNLVCCAAEYPRANYVWNSRELDVACGATTWRLGSRGMLQRNR
jgi:hypothetical protein